MNDDLNSIDDLFDEPSDEQVDARIDAHEHVFTAEESEKARAKAEKAEAKAAAKAKRQAEQREHKLERQGEKSNRARGGSNKVVRTEPRSKAVRIALTSGRMLIGITGVAATVVVLGGIALVPWPSWGVAAPVVNVNPDSAQQQRVCPGPLLTVGANSSKASSVMSIGAASVFTTGGSASPLSSQNPNAGTDGSPQLFEAPFDAAPLAASQLQTIALESYAGLAAAACTEPATETWLVGGGTTLGVNSVIVLSNPTDVAAQVQLELFGASGKIAAAGLGGITVDPGQQVEYPLSGFAPNEAKLVVHVVSDGGRISAAIDVTQIDGLTPVGAAVIDPSTGPAKIQTIPGVVVDGSSVSAERGDGADGFATLRLVAPIADADVTARVIGENGIAGTALTTRLQAGVVADLPITGVAPGSYSVIVESSVPIVAGAQSALTAAEGTDFTWYAAASPMQASVGLAVPAGVPATLHLMNPSATALTLTLGTGRQIPVPAGAAVAVAVDGTQTLANGGDGMFASLSLQSPGRLASFAVPGGAGGASSVAVYTR